MIAQSEELGPPDLGFSALLTRLQRLTDTPPRSFISSLLFSIAAVKASPGDLSPWAVLWGGWPVADFTRVDFKRNSMPSTRKIRRLCTNNITTMCTPFRRKIKNSSMRWNSTVSR